MTDSLSIGTPSTSSISLSIPAPASVPPHELVFKNQHFRPIEHRASKRRGLEPSKIWEHGTDYECLDDASSHGWRYAYCFKNYLVVIKHGVDVTTNARRHLKLMHSIHLESARSRKRLREDIEDEEDIELVRVP